MEVEAIDVTKDFDPDPELNETLEKYTDVVEGKMGEVLGEFKCDLDGRFSSVRTKETNLGNLVTDIMVAALNADCALLNSGTLRSDQLHKAGEFSLRVRNISSNCQISICCLQYGDNCDNGDNGSGLTGHPSHDGRPNSSRRLWRDDSQGEEIFHKFIIRSRLAPEKLISKWQPSD